MRVTPTPEWFFGLLLTQVLPVVLMFMITGAVLGLIVKGLRA